MSDAALPLTEDGRLHGLQEDALGILAGTLLVSLGVLFYAEATLLVGGVADLARPLAYVSPVAFWLGFFPLNLPFFAFA